MYYIYTCVCVFGVHIFLHYPYKTVVHDYTVYMAYIYIYIHTYLVKNNTCIF